MNKILLYIFSYTKFGKLLDGKKTVVGAVLIIAASALQALENIAPLFPDYKWIGEAAAALKTSLESVHGLLEGLGLGLLTVGVLHKNAKSKAQ